MLDPFLRVHGLQHFMQSHHLSRVASSGSRGSEMDSPQQLVAVMVLYVVVTSWMVRSEQVVMLWGLATGIMVGCCGHQFCAALAALVGAALGLITIQATVLLLVSHTLGTTHLALIGLVDHRPWVVTGVTLVTVIAHLLERGAVRVLVSVLMVSAGIVHGSRMDNLKTGLQVWGTALGFDLSAAQHLLQPALVIAGVVGMGLALTRVRDSPRNA